MDGGTQGLFLLPWVGSAKSLLILDAIDFGLQPGELRVILGDEVPRYMGVKKISMHQTSFQEVLSTCDLAGTLPERIALVGVQPDTFDDYGGSLRPEIRARVADAVKASIDVLSDWGISARARASGEGSELTAPAAIGIDEYERRNPAGKTS
jgi:hydrogenase maturation protease